VTLKQNGNHLAVALIHLTAVGLDMNFE